MLNPANGSGSKPLLHVDDDVQVKRMARSDGLGGFASGTNTSAGRVRRYHALLLVATRLLRTNGSC